MCAHLHALLLEVLHKGGVRSQCVALSSHEEHALLPLLHACDVVVQSSQHLARLRRLVLHACTTVSRTEASASRSNEDIKIRNDWQGGVPEEHACKKKTEFERKNVVIIHQREEITNNHPMLHNKHCTDSQTE